MSRRPDHVHVQIWTGNAPVDPSDRMVRVLARILKETPEQVCHTLESSSIRMRRVRNNKDFKHLSESLVRHGFTVEIVDTQAPPIPDAPIEVEQTTRVALQPSVDWKPGEVIEGLYEVQGSAAGGMGRVYFVFHRLWKMMLAIKTPHLSTVKSETGVLRFMREAEYWVHLGVHPNIATCYYARVINGLPRMFIEYVDGGSLSERLDKEPIQDFREVSDLMLQFCHGMMHAEDRGMVHRDIKPANCLLSRNGVVKITDFGLVKRIDEASGHPSAEGDIPESIKNLDPSITDIEGGVMGSPWYMAPERFLREGKEDIRSDIYSFGVMLYEVALNGMPFAFPKGFSLAKLVRSHLKKPPIDPVSVRPDIPLRLADIMLRCMEKKPQDRYGSFVEICEDLELAIAEMAPHSKPRRRPNIVSLKADSLNNQAVSLVDLGREEEATKLFEEATSADTDHLQAVFNYETRRWTTGEISDQDVLNRMEALKIEVRGTDDYKHLMGLIGLQRGDAANAAALLTEASMNNPHYRARWSSYADSAERFVESLGLAPIEEQVSLAGHLRGLLALGFSSDGAGAITVGEDRSIRVWDLTTRRCLKNIRTFSLTPVAGAISPGGPLVATGYGAAFKTLDLWSVRSGQVLRKYHGAAVSGLAFSPDGELLAASSEDGSVKIWRTNSDESVWELPSQPSPVRRMCFLQSGRQIVLGFDDGSIEMWSFDSTAQVLRIRGHEGPVSSLCVSKSDEFVVSGGHDELIRLWDLSSGQAIGSVTGHRGPVVSLSLAPGDSYLVSAASSGEAKIWELAASKCLRTIRTPDEQLSVTVMSEDGRRLMMGGARGSAKVWSLDMGWFKRNFLEPAFCRPKTFEELEKIHGEFETALTSFKRAWGQSYLREALDAFDEIRGLPGFLWSREAILARNLLKGSLKVVELQACPFIRSVGRHLGAVTCLDASRDGLLLLSGSLDGTAALWDVVTGERLRSLDTGGPVREARFLARYDEFMTWSEDGTLCKWSLKGEQLLRVDGLERPAMVSSDGKSVTAMSRSNAPVRVQLDTGATKPIGPQFEAPELCCFSADSKVLFGLRQGKKIQRWIVENGRNVGTFRDLGFEITALLPTASGDRIIAGLETGEVHSYIVNSGMNVSSFRGHSQAVRCMDAGPDDNLWVTGSDDCTIRIWDLKGECCLFILDGHGTPVRSLRVFPSGSMIAGGAQDGSIRLWGLEWDFSRQGLI